jgi:D-arabinose 1-dehydrogenase-like Zn-dependent alcohol dehydrogenase
MKAMAVVDYVKIARVTMGFSAGLPLPHVAGHEIVGVVAEAGRDAQVGPGTRVVVYDYETCGSCPSCRAEAGYDAVIETSGDPAAMTRLASLLNPGGRIVLVGYSPGRPGETDAESLVLAEAAILGSRFAARADLVAAVNLLASGAIRSVVTEEFAFGDANRALEAVRAGRALGRVTVRVS